ncbi:hypothetical protein SAMN02745150_01037 [Brevinema andersonii]|uniref:Uncharacterized protein n=1 Tax=Brevinema andersonii TaxID=34097 RepID=A0A1I1EAW6_BREAD|nr:hypothetical protein [Brevinema andersonii]SFB84284.1 hypothetical protein SAMN02745150_01037 [Brevinema andersonii]
MKLLLIIICFFLYNGCALQDTGFVKATDVPVKPANGYDRNTLFTPYIKLMTLRSSIHLTGTTGQSFYGCLKKRTFWIPSSSDFKRQYPFFNVTLLSINNIDNKRSFTFAERLFLADVFDLLSFAINSSVFEEEMMKKKFFDNSGTTPKDPKEIIKEIRHMNFPVSIAKRSLDAGVAAEATVGGFSHTIWLRDDTDYTKQEIVQMAVIIGHELTHNLGYHHSSLVNYGVHQPIQGAIQHATPEQVKTFISVTPFHEDEFLYKIRNTKDIPTNGTIISKSYNY